MAFRSEAAVLADERDRVAKRKPWLALVPASKPDPSPVEPEPEPFAWHSAAEMIEKAERGQ